ncbi:MAG: prepilin-type N-terminal cleavage/methylation domain-containing protein, partial [Saccharofermentans sp.]|nr:prepilin-type N-terminal cleavage/methylation domain-containing protein [Saccharofermentans sp.]
MKKNLNKKGFTLIEAIVVVAIITIVTGVTVISIGSSMERYQQSAADAANRQFPEAMILTRRNILDANNNGRIRQALDRNGSNYTHGDGNGESSGDSVITDEETP